VIHLTRALARELSPYNIRANRLCVSSCAKADHGMSAS
jgi:NAD(P)-dependent dehydrogenase (short-subunit alcohol dehydrogenase family)